MSAPFVYKSVDGKWVVDFGNGTYRDGLSADEALCLWCGIPHPEGTGKMSAQSEFLMGDAWWAYLKSKSDNRNELAKREDIAAEAREEEGGYWENFNPWERLDSE